MAVVASRIRDGVLTGIFSAGEQLKQQQIADDLGVSHIPVREAFKVLEAEGFVVCQPRRGAFVADLTVETADEIWELRRELEPFAVRKAMPRITQGHVASAAEVMRLAAKTEDHISWMSLNWRFHRTLYAAAGRPMLLGMLDGLWRNVDRYCTVLTQANGQQHVLCDHEAILDAFVRRDTDVAVDLITNHMAQVHAKVSNLLRRRHSANKKSP